MQEANQAITLNQPNPITAYFPDGRPAPLLMTYSEVAALLRMDDVRFVRDAVDRLRKERALPAVAIGKRVLYPLPEVLTWLAKQQERYAR
jgi:hypothetical protein